MLYANIASSHQVTARLAITAQRALADLLEQLASPAGQRLLSSEQLHYLALVTEDLWNLLDVCDRE